MTQQHSPRPWPEVPLPVAACREEVSPAELLGTVRAWTYRQPSVGLVTAGSFRYRSEHGETCGLPGMLIIGNTGEPFEVHHHDPLGNRRALVFLDQRALDEVAEAEGRGAARFEVSTLAPGRRCAIVAGRIRALSSRHPPDEAIAYLLMADLLRCSRPPTRAVAISPRQEARLRGAVRYIQAHFEQPCGLDLLSDLCGMSRYHFLRCFQRLVGITPNQYLLHLRLIAAAQRLSATDEAVADIALDVGFNDLSHFYRQFRQRFACAPVQWRRRH